jgi:Rad3-related DNA helicase
MPIQLPLWVEEVYPHQLKAITDILDTYESGHSVAVLDAPTGSGKTLIAELVRQSLNARAIYICSSLSLQEQFFRDFPDAAIIRGRANYTTHLYADQYPDINAGDCTKVRLQDELICEWCDPVSFCPYERAKRAAIGSDLMCANIQYFLHEANYVKSIPIGRQLIIVDEADLLEEALLHFVEVHISEHKAKQLDIAPPEKKTVESAWIEWAVYAESHLKDIYQRDSRFHGNTPTAIRQRKSLENLIRNVGRLNDNSTGLRAGGWVYTGYDRGDIAFKPITVDHIARDYLWRHCSRWLLMSATTISFRVLMESLGL